MFKQKCNFHKSVWDTTKTTREFTVYESGDEYKPEYIKYEDVPKFIDSAKLGDYLETVDGFITPIIKDYRYQFRIAANTGRAYLKSYIRKGKILLYFTPPRAYFTYQKKDSKLWSVKEKSFCWLMAKSYNKYTSIVDAGYQIKGNQQILSYAEQLLKKKSIQDGIVEAYRKQIEIVSDEPKFVINRFINLQDTIERRIRKVEKQLDNGGVSEAEINLLNSMISFGIEMAKINADLLGYGKEKSEEFNLQVKGKRTFNYNLSPVKKAEFEVIEANELESVEEEKDIKKEISDETV